MHGSRGKTAMVFGPGKGHIGAYTPLSFDKMGTYRSAAAVPPLRAAHLLGDAGAAISSGKGSGQGGRRLGEWWRFWQPGGVDAIAHRPFFC